jgi:hypothetical protein
MAQINTWGHFKAEYLRRTQLDMTLARRSKDYRRECCERIVRGWRNRFEEDIEERKIASISRTECDYWAHSITRYFVTTYNNTVATMRAIFNIAVE